MTIPSHGRVQVLRERVSSSIEISVSDSGVSVHPRWSALESDLVEARLAGVGDRADAARNDLRQIDGSAHETDPPGGDAAHVEEVIDQAREMADLLADDAAGVHGARLLGADDVEHVDGAGNDFERVAQLVPEHREELVLGAVGGLRILARRVLALEERGTRLGRPTLHRDVGDDGD
jgi:hypothetical protein